MDVMLDLETFATTPDAAIVQIGACTFDPRTQDGTRDRFCCNVNLASSVLLGLRVDPATLDWWSKRDYNHLILGTVSLGQALFDFTTWFHKHTTADTFVWSHGASFDVPVLALSYAKIGEPAPWHYRQVRDTRTFFAVAEDFGWMKPKSGEPAHQALQDAVQQAHDVQSAASVVYRP
jgi:exodeoxyribonuclease VIII